MRNSEEYQNELQMTVYLLQCLTYMGISIPDTVHMSLTNLLTWYEATQDLRYIETASLQLHALIKMGLTRECDLPLYQKVAGMAGWSEAEVLNKKMYRLEKIKVNKSQVRSMIRRWMPSRDNPMTIGEVVDDIIDKVNNCKLGQYYYRYQRRPRTKNTEDMGDIYKLVIEPEQSFLLDLSRFICYTFQKVQRK